MMAPSPSDALLLALAALVAWRTGRRGLRLDLLCTAGWLVLALASWGVAWGWASSRMSTDATALSLGAIGLAGAPLLRYAAGRIRRGMVLSAAQGTRDRAWGWASGGAKGAGVLVVGSLVMDVANELAQARAPAPTRAWSQAPVAQADEPSGTLDPGTRDAFGRLGHAFGELLYPPRTHAQLRALRTVLGADADELSGQPEVARILEISERPTVIAALDDPALRDEIEQLARGSPSAIVAIGRSAKIRAMLDDPEVKALVASLDLVALAEGIEAVRLSAARPAGR